MVSASTPDAAKSTGRMPTACTASVCSGTPCSWATSASSRDRVAPCRPRCSPTSRTPARRTREPSRARPRSVAGRHPAVPVDRQPGRRRRPRARPATRPTRARRGARSRRRAIRVRRGSAARRAQYRPLTARLSLSVPPVVSTISDGRAPTAAAIRSRDSSTRAARPAARRVQRRGVAGARQRLGHHRRRPRAASAWWRRGRGRWCPVLCSGSSVHGSLAVPSVCRGSRVVARPRRGRARGHRGDDDVVPVVAAARVELAPAGDQPQHGAGRRAVDQRRREGVLGVALDGDDPVPERPSRPTGRPRPGRPARARRGGRRRPGPDRESTCPAITVGPCSPGTAPRAVPARPTSGSTGGTSTPSAPDVQVDEALLDAEASAGAPRSARSVGPAGAGATGPASGRARRAPAEVARRPVQRAAGPGPPTAMPGADDGTRPHPSRQRRRRRARLSARPAGGRRPSSITSTGPAPSSSTGAPAGTAPRPAPTSSSTAAPPTAAGSRSGPAAPPSPVSTAPEGTVPAPVLSRVICGSSPLPLSISSTV